MNASHQVTHVNVRAGPHARRSRSGKALIDAGSPQSFVSCSFFESMLASGRASPFAVQNVRERKWSGFNGTSLSSGKIIRLNVQCFGAFSVATVQLAVNAYIVPDGAMAHKILLGTDSWAPFPVREYKDIGDHETILTLRTTQHEDRFCESFSESTRMAAYTECIFQNDNEHKIVFDADKTAQFEHDNRYWITVRVETGRGWKVS